MFIKKLGLKNFKSFNDLTLELSNLNVLIGPNGAGKSNLISAFKFLHDILEYGLEEAIQIQGGMRFLFNQITNLPNKLSFYIKMENTTSDDLLKQKSLTGSYDLIEYSFSLNVRPKYIYSVFKERLKIVRYNLDENKSQNGANSKESVFTQKNSHENNENNYIGKNESYLEINRTYNRISLKVREGKKSFIVYLKTSRDHPFRLRDIPKYIKMYRGFLSFSFSTINQIFRTENMEKQLFIGRFGSYLFDFFETIRNIRVFDIDPKLPKTAVPIAGSYRLDGDGKNISLILKKILSSEKQRDKFLRIVKSILPFIQRINIEKWMQNSIIFKIKEQYGKNTLNIPASLVSDGTIKIIGLIIILYFEKSEILIVKKPEKNIHPAIISGIAELIRDSSKTRQLIITTHSPEFIKYIPLNQLFLTRRNMRGYSEVNPAAREKEVIEFLKYDLGIDDLFIQNLL